MENQWLEDSPFLFGNGPIFTGYGEFQGKFSIYYLSERILWLFGPSPSNKLFYTPKI